MESIIYNKVSLLEYNGTNYSGWQKQKNAISIQSLIEAALLQIYGSNISTIGSGRTDKGVHSLGQVFSFRAHKIIDNDRLKRGINALIPTDIKVLDIKDIDINFNALHNVISKTYVYKIINRDTPLTLERDFALWIRKKIDLDILAAALSRFVGKKDFAAFTMTKSLKENSVREINFINIISEDDKILVVINANGFLHNMVRIIVSTALEIAINGKDPNLIDNILSSKNRIMASKTESPVGLYQLKVFYDQEIFNIDESLLLRRL